MKSNSWLFLKNLEDLSSLDFHTCYTLFYQCGEGNGTPLHYSRLENPMDGGAW